MMSQYESVLLHRNDSERSVLRFGRSSQVWTVPTNRDAHMRAIRRSNGVLCCSESGSDQGVLGNNSLKTISGNSDATASVLLIHEVSRKSRRRIGTPAFRHQQQKSMLGLRRLHQEPQRYLPLPFSDFYFVQILFCTVASLADNSDVGSASSPKHASKFCHCMQVLPHTAVAVRFSFGVFWDSSRLLRFAIQQPSDSILLPLARFNERA